MKNNSKLLVVALSIVALSVACVSWWAIIGDKFSQNHFPSKEFYESRGSEILVDFQDYYWQDPLGMYLPEEGLPLDYYSNIIKYFAEYLYGAPLDICDDQGYVKQYRLFNYVTDIPVYIILEQFTTEDIKYSRFKELYRNIYTELPSLLSSLLNFKELESVGARIRFGDSDGISIFERSSYMDEIMLSKYDTYLKLRNF